MPPKDSIFLRAGTTTQWGETTHRLRKNEPGYDELTGKTVIGDGESTFDELPDLRKQFQNIVTVAKSGKKGSADFICSDSKWGGSDAACIQTVLDLVPDNTQLTFGDGTFNINGVISQTGKNLTLKGGNNTIFNMSGAGDDTPGIQIQGAKVLETTLTSDFDTTTNVITLSSVIGVQVGDLIEIYNDVLWCPDDYPLQKTGEMYEVFGIASNNITLSQNLLREYLASNTNIIIYRSIQIHIEDIKFKGTGVYDNVYCMRLSYCSNSSITNCRFADHGRRSLILIGCFNFDISKTYIKNSCFGSEATGYSGYGIGVSNASAFINIHHNRIENCRHCIMSGTSEFKGLNRDVLISFNFLSGGGTEKASVIDSHETTINYIIVENTIYPKRLTTINGWARYAFADGTLESIFANNRIVGGGGVIRRGAFGNRATIISNNRLEHTNGARLYNYKVGCHGSTLIINGNHVSDCIGSDGSYGKCIEIAGESTKYCEICNNVFENISHEAITILHDPGTAKAKYIISNNIINGAVVNGMTVSRVDPTSVIEIEINNNIVDGSQKGITIVDTNGARIINNNVSNCNIGIREATLLAENATDNTKIYTNKISNCTTPIIKLGAATELFKNSGYKTENTDTATITASTTSIVVNHGLVTTPTRYFASPTANIGNCWITNPTATQMTINCSSAPASDTVVCWSAQVV